MNHESQEASQETKVQPSLKGPIEAGSEIDSDMRFLLTIAPLLGPWESLYPESNDDGFICEQCRSEHDGCEDGDENDLDYQDFEVIEQLPLSPMLATYSPSPHRRNRHRRPHGRRPVDRRPPSARRAQ